MDYLLRGREPGRPNGSSGPKPKNNPYRWGERVSGRNVTRSETAVNESDELRFRLRSNFCRFGIAVLEQN